MTLFYHSFLEECRLCQQIQYVAKAKEAKLLRLRERIIQDTGKQDYSTSLCRKWLDGYTAKTVHDAVFLASSHELKKPD